MEPASAPQNTKAGSLLDRRRNWYVFRIFNLYRLTLVAVLLGVFVFDSQTRLLGKLNPQLFFWSGVAYIVMIIVSTGLSFWRKPDLPVQAHVQALLDIVFLSLMVYFSGGLGCLCSTRRRACWVS